MHTFTSNKPSKRLERYTADLACLNTPVKQAASITTLHQASDFTDINDLHMPAGSVCESWATRWLMCDSSCDFLSRRCS